MHDRCVNCGRTEVELKRGWTNALYCSEYCERADVSILIGSMPGVGWLPKKNYVPSPIDDEISRRWEDKE